MKKLLFTTWLFFFALGTAWAEESPVTQIPATQTSLESAFAPFERVSSVQADFVQQNHLSLFAEPVESKGFFVFQKNPSALRFVYTQPFEKGLLLAHNQVWRLSKDTKTLIKGAMSQTVAAQLVVWLTLDRAALCERYTITPFAGGLTFTPNAAQALAQINVWFHDTLPGALKRVELIEHGGDKTVLQFTNVRLNEPIDGSVFNG